MEERAVGPFFSFFFACLPWLFLVFVFFSFSKAPLYLHYVVYNPRNLTYLPQLLWLTFTDFMLLLGYLFSATGQMFQNDFDVRATQRRVQQPRMQRGATRAMSLIYGIY